MQVNEAINKMLHGNDTEAVVEEFKFTTGKPDLGLAFSSVIRAKVVTASLDPLRTQCGDVGDFRKALTVFARSVKKFLEFRGWQPVGKPFLCDGEFVWAYENDPAKEDKFQPKKPTPELFPRRRRSAVVGRKQARRKPFLQRMGISR